MVRPVVIEALSTPPGELPNDYPLNWMPLDLRSQITSSPWMISLLWVCGLFCHQYIRRLIHIAQEVFQVA